MFHSVGKQGQRNRAALSTDKTSMNNCLTWNAVYGIHCKMCGKIMYVGETSRSVGERLKEHLANIKYNRQTVVAAHFNEDSHSDTDAGFVILECVRDKSKYYRVSVNYSGFRSRTLKC